MERTMSVEERIRRAEERYNQKNGQTLKSEERSTNTSAENIIPKKGNVKKLLMQIFVVLVIYIAFYAINNREYIFSENFKNDVNIFLTEKTKIYQMYTDAKTYIGNKLLSDNQNSVQPEQTQTSTDNTTENNAQNSNSEKLDEQTNNSDLEKTDEETINNTEDVGGSEENVSNINENDENAQMLKDAEKIKSTISFITPVEGRISSTFGWRNPTVSTVPKYHTGLDIAAVSGTVIKSATDGKVILASSEGDYGNHYQIQTDDVIIIYAHCQKLYLKEGDTVIQGQEIAEVGSTGNSTGPHLHFELRIEDRKVDPQLILDI